MKKIKEWFLGLSRIGKASVIGVLLFGAMTVSGAQRPVAPPAVEQNQVDASTVDHEVDQPVVTSDTLIETKDIAFERQTIEDSSVAKGTSVIRTPGQNGTVTVTHKITLHDGKEVDRQTTEEVTKNPITEVTAIGTYVKPAPACDSSYSGCVPIVNYDLDCADIGYSVEVYGYDKHGLDRDGDGAGCESY